MVLAALNTVCTLLTDLRSYVPGTLSLVAMVTAILAVVIMPLRGTDSVAHTRTDPTSSATAIEVGTNITGSVDVQR